MEVREMEAPARFKLWLQVEEFDDFDGEYNDVSEPICIGEFDEEAQAFVRAYMIGQLFDGLTAAEKQHLQDCLNQVPAAF